MTRKKIIIWAEGVEVHADRIRNKSFNMGTGNHEGQNRKAEKNVTIEVRVPSSSQGSTEEHPKAGRIYKTDKADINAKRIFGPWPSQKYGRSQKRIMAEQDVTVQFVEDQNKRGLRKS